MRSSQPRPAHSRDQAYQRDTSKAVSNSPFSGRGQTDSPIHSVPDMKDTDRVFVSVVFGSAREIRDMCRKQSLVYRECDPEGVLPSRRLAEQFAGYIFDQA